MTIDTLYEAFMDIDESGDPTGSTSFAEDVFGFFGKGKMGGYGQEEWAKQYGTYLPTFDPAQIHLAERERDLDYRNALNTLETTQAATERVYTTELDTLSTALGKELSKGKQIAGRTGLRSGSLESAIQDTISTTGSKAKDFGDRTIIAGKETEDKYRSAMVDTALDFDKTERQEKEEFYDRTMAAIMRLMDKEAFEDTGLKDFIGENPESVSCYDCECFTENTSEECAKYCCGVSADTLGDNEYFEGCAVRGLFECSDGSCVPNPLTDCSANNPDSYYVNPGGDDFDKQGKTAFWGCFGEAHACYQGCQDKGFTDEECIAWIGEYKYTTATGG